MEECDTYIVKPEPGAGRLTETVSALSYDGVVQELTIINEGPLTLFLNSREIVTMMTINDFPELLGVGYLINQNMLKPDDVVTAVEYDEELSVVVVRTARETNYEDKLKKKVLTSGCAQGTVFGDQLEAFERIKLSNDTTVRTSAVRRLLKTINTTPSLYQEAGAIHGCVLCEGERPLIYMEDVGRHNALDKIAGYMYLNGILGADKILYTTGRMTSEMVIKTVQMGIPILVSRSGSTAWGVELARQVGLTLISRARGKRFMILNGYERVIFDLKPEPQSHRRVRRVA